MPTPIPDTLPLLLDPAWPETVDRDFSAPFGLFGRRKIKAMAGSETSFASRTDGGAAFQPASLDLRLSKEAYRVRARFLPGRARTVKDHLMTLNPEPISLAGDGAVLEGIVYTARLAEQLGASSEHVRSRQPEEFDRAPRHFHPSDRESAGSVRRSSARLRRRAMA